MEVSFFTRRPGYEMLFALQSFFLSIYDLIEDIFNKKKSISFKINFLQ